MKVLQSECRRLMDDSAIDLGLFSLGSELLLCFEAACEFTAWGLRPTSQKQAN